MLALSITVEIEVRTSKVPLPDVETIVADLEKK
jgi:hypothetical protein